MDKITLIFKRLRDLYGELPIVVLNEETSYAEKEELYDSFKYNCTSLLKELRKMLAIKGNEVSDEERQRRSEWMKKIRVNGKQK